jgi:hypothetical protein
MSLNLCIHEVEINITYFLSKNNSEKRGVPIGEKSASFPPIDGGDEHLLLYHRNSNL